MTVVIQEPLLMEVEMEVSSPLVESSDIDVTTDIDCQGPLLEHVRHQEAGLEIKLYAEVGLLKDLLFLWPCVLPTCQSKHTLN